MQRSPASNSHLRIFLFVSALAAGAALGLLANEADAKPMICPQFLAKYCVVNSAGRIFTAFTNPCFAKEQHLRVLYMGACRFSPRIMTCKGTRCV